MTSFYNAIIVLFFVSSQVFAVQEKDTFAVAGGFTSFNQRLSNSNGSIESDSGTTEGMYTGVFGEMPWKPRLYFCPGIFLSQKGTSDTTATFKASYLETSGILKWYFVDESNFRAFLGAGLGFGILISAEQVGTNGSWSDTFGLQRKNELSGQGGLGFEFSIAKDTALQFGGSYVRSITDNLERNVQGLSGRWEGFYGFAALRFKTEREDNSPEKRARDYINFRYQNFSNEKETWEEGNSKKAVKEGEWGDEDHAWAEKDTAWTEQDTAWAEEGSDWAEEPQESAPELAPQKPKKDEKVRQPSSKNDLSDEFDWAEPLKSEPAPKQASSKKVLSPKKMAPEQNKKASQKEASSSWGWDEEREW